MISERFPNSDRQQSKLDLAIADPEGLVKQSLIRLELKRRSRLVWIFVSSFSVLACGVVFALVILFSSGSVLNASEKTVKAWSLWKQRKLAEAEVQFREALKEDDQDDSAWNGLGWCLCNMGRSADAIEAFKNCLAIKPNHPAAMNGIGQSALAAGDLDLAEEYLKKGCDEFRKSVPDEQVTAQNLPAAWYGLVTLYLLKEDFSEAQKWAERIAKVVPNDQQVKSMLEQAKKGDSSETKRMFQREPDASKAQKAWSLWQQRKLPEAEAMFREVVKENDKDANSWNGLGWCLTNSGKPAEAIDAFKKCLAIVPDHMAALNGVGQCSLATKDWKSAEEYLLKSSDGFEKMIPEEQWNENNIPAAWFGLATLFIVNENYDKAIEWSERIVKYAPKSPEALKLLEHAKNKDNAYYKGLLGVK